MTAFIEFELSQWDEATGTDDVMERKFLVVDLPAADLWPTIGDEEGDFAVYIEDLEHQSGPTNGTIDQGGSMSPDRSTATWDISSSEIQDREAFVDQTVAKIQELYGWTLEEVK